MDESDFHSKYFQNLILNIFCGKSILNFNDQSKKLNIWYFLMISSYVGMALISWLYVYCFMKIWANYNLKIQQNKYFQNITCSNASREDYVDQTINFISYSFILLAFIKIWSFELFMKVQRYVFWINKIFINFQNIDLKIFCMKITFTRFSLQFLGEELSKTNLLLPIDFCVCEGVNFYELGPLRF